MSQLRRLQDSTHATERTRNPRYTLPNKLSVVTGTIGSKITYPLTARVVSRSGMLLSWDSPIQVPFIPNTILALTIDTGSEAGKESVSCLAKVVGKFSKSQNRRDFGVAIVQIDSGDATIWEAWIAGLASRGQATTRQY